MSLNIKTIVGDYNGDSFGYSSAIGDIDGNGRKELIIASTNYKNGGKISIYSSKTFKLIKTILLNRKKINTIRLLAVDINKDNIDELIVAVTYEDLTGEVKIFSVPNNKMIYNWKSTREHDVFGFSIATGDVDGDGILDIIIGAPQPIENGKGKVFVYSGKDGTLLEEFTSKVPRGGSDFGTSVAAADINNDGIDEIIIGAPGLPKGEVFIYSARYGWLINKLTGDPGFGFVVYANDINGDGYDELIITTKSLEGNRVSVFQTNHFRHLYDITNEDVDVGFGETLTTCDINGDGVNELIVGAFDSYHRRKKNTGLVNIYNGSNQEILHRWYGKEVYDQFGFSLSVGKLVDGGKESLIIGAPRYTTKKKGLVYIVTL